jgi:LCP family protein required for cell wall assembly
MPILPQSLSSAAKIPSRNQAATGGSMPPANKPSLPKKPGRWKKILLGVVVVLVALGGLAFWKADSTFKKISTGGGLLSNITKSLPGATSQLKGEADGRINILLLAMRGEGVEGGGTLADTIMVLSIHPAKDANDTSRASLVSVPRDLYVTVPGRDEKRKINAVYALGLERNPNGGGMEDMKTIVGQVTGQPIHYAAVLNFQGFVDLVNSLGGVTVHLDTPFNEGVQFHEPKVCDPYVYTVPTKPIQYENKYHTRADGTKYLAKSYPLCYNKSEECGGNFTLPAGDNHLDGLHALCFSRARYTSSDFERARRQQEVMQLVKDKALSLGTLSDIATVNKMIDALGNNLKMDLEAWELNRFLSIYKEKFTAVKPTSKVLEDSEEGLLYAPPMTKETGYILLPRGDNYDRIKAFFQALP